ncbi:MAG: hypothetical protein ACLR7Z_13080 [Bilophila wadsworthia]
MIIDFRMRPPARGFLNIGVYDDVARTAKLTECFSMKQAPSVAQKSPELMLQEMDTAGVTMGVIPGRNGHFKGSISNDDIISLLGDFQAVSWAWPGPIKGKSRWKKSTAPC